MEKSRYARDQFRLIRSLMERYGVDAALQAIGFCQRIKLYSANTMRDYLEYQATMANVPRSGPPPAAILVDDPKYHVTTQKRSLADYAKVGDSGC